MAYTPIDKSDDYFNTVLYTGNGSVRTITGVGFQPDWVWVKDRSSANYHYLYDSVRGNNLNIFSNDVSAEVNVTTGQNSGGIGSQASDGFNIVSGLINTNNVNTSGNLYASWNWLAGNGTASNTDGSITSTVSANTTSGFSIVSYTGNQTNSTVGHGLGVAPKLIIFKNRVRSDGDWIVGSTVLSSNWSNFLYFSGTNAVTSISLFQDTAPTSSVFYLGTNNNINQTGSGIVAYCFAEKKGFSKFGSYTGNGSSDGPFIYTGFKPAFIVLKQTSASGQNWQMMDNKRNPYNFLNKVIYPNLSQGEDTTGTGSNTIDFVSNGWKSRGSNAQHNNSGSTYFYMAFAENPFVTSTGIPACAR